MKSQRTKAQMLHQLHHSSNMLVLPNIWDKLGAKLVEHEGFKVIATASAAYSYTKGVEDGENIQFNDLLKLLKEICDNTELPVTADIEKGYAIDNTELYENTIKILKTGVVGINIEDTTPCGMALLSIADMCTKINTIRRAANRLSIPLFINARTDIFMIENGGLNKSEEAIKRAQAYKNAGADGFYPILCNTQELMTIKTQVQMPINVFATKDTPSIPELEKMGIARVSLGPSLLKAAITKMQQVLRSIKSTGCYDSFTNESTISSSDIHQIIKS